MIQYRVVQIRQNPSSITRICPLRDTAITVAPNYIAAFRF